MEQSHVLCDMRLINKIIDSLPVELHLPKYQFCGPGTRLLERLARGETGVNKLDESCRLHDIAYFKDKDLESRRKADLELSKVAGERFRASDATLGERASAALVKTAMVIKNKLGAGLRNKKKPRTKRRLPRVLQVPRFGAGRRRRVGGFIVPLAAALTAGIGAIKTVKDIKNAKRVLEEQQRHHRALEQIARERGVRVGAGKRKKKIGGKLKRRRGKCARKTLRFL